MPKKPTIIGSDMAEDFGSSREVREVKRSVLSTDLPGWTPSCSIFNQEGFGAAAPGSQRRVSKSHLAEKSAFPSLFLSVLSFFVPSSEVGSRQSFFDS